MKKGILVYNNFQRPIFSHWYYYNSLIKMKNLNILNRVKPELEHTQVFAFPKRRTEYILDFL